MLNKFGIDASGALTWSGNPVGSGVDAGAFVTLATEQTITGKKTFSADTVFATKLYVPSTAGAGVYDVFIDDTGAVSGETPSAGGGLDEDELWSILSAQTSDVNEVIDRTHLPSTLVYDDDLAEALEGYVSGSDLSTALQPYLTKTEAAETYATKDSLKDYVTLATAQTITGKKTFSADAVFAAKLYVPSSAGAGVYDVFIDDNGAVSGETPSAGGGLDEDELWSILSAQTSDVNEVIDRTHLPSTLVYDDDLAEALEGYVSGSDLSTALQPYLTKTEAAETYATKDSLKDYVTLATAQTITGKKTFSADAVFAAKLYVPSSAGAGVYDVYIDDSGAVSGETPSAEGEGLDIDAMWNELAADDASRAIHLSHIPLIPWANVSGKPMTLQGYGLLTEADNRYVRQVTGMGLSSNDYTDGEKEKLSGIDAGAQVNVLESVKLNGYLLQITSKAVNVNAMTSLSVPTGLSAGDMTSAGKISVSLASGYVIPKNTAKFWGRTWNGLADVSGAIEGATDIDASGTVYAATAIRTNKLYVPSTSGNNIYDIFIDDSGAVSGEAPAAGEGLDIDAMWDELATDDASRTIHLSHIPAIPTSKITGLDTVLAPYATQAWVQQQGYLTPSNYASTLDSRYAIQANDNNLICHDNEFNFIPTGYSNEVNVNWRAKGGTGDITRYKFCKGRAISNDLADVYALQYYAGANHYPVWHSGNDGSGSGLDADLLDGYHSSSFFRRVDGEPTNDYSFGFWDGVGSYASFSINTYGGQFKFTTRPYYRYILANNPYSDWNGIAFLTDNVASATKLQTSRTLWGQSFNGEGNVSGAISSTGNITPSAAGSYNIGTAALWYEHIYGRYIDTASGYNLRLCTGGVERLSIDSSSGYVGIGTTSPAYKLDVAGTLRATGDIWTGGKLYIPSTAGNNVYDIFLDDTGAVHGEVPGIDSLDKITDLDPSWQPVLQEEPALLFAGRVSSTGTVTKYAGTGTLSCTRSATGIYALTLKDDSQSAVSLYNCCVTATALYTSSTSAAYICTTNYVSSVYSVKISNLASGALANCAFNIVILK